MIQSEKAWTFQAVQKRKKPLAIQKDTTATEKQRDIFGEMMEGITAMKAHREGKITLRTLQAEPLALPEVDAALIRETRAQLNVSRRVFARQLHVNERTLEKKKPRPLLPTSMASLSRIQTIQKTKTGFFFLERIQYSQRWKQ